MGDPMDNEEPKRPKRFPNEQAIICEPEDEVHRRRFRTGSPPATLLCEFPDPAPKATLNQFRFELVRDKGAEPGLFGYLGKYVCATHLVWSMCAALADCNIDPEWTKTFEMWRPQWREFSKSFEYHGNTERTVVIAPSPVREMWIQRPDNREVFKLRVDYFQERERDRDDLDDLWKFMLKVPLKQIVDKAFLITLKHESWFPYE
ncbi:hypothetical protein N7457_000406 [Penicillium paradoxum]|uniref:uncharacterized protein n=1 Tax=Penicillium paradoxum TaxID=176176 RepID=UPI00254664D7|nr:uncharacterized protein N7457_000406 [Penicillium paradoxum]KAJ5793807.1 hypothetical protein N7457_000406 [Penicillium paradoxum]